MSCPSVRIPAKMAQSIHQMEFYENLIEMGHQVDILAREGKGKTDIDIEKVFSKEVPLARLFFNIDSRSKLKRLLRDNDYDVVHDRGYLFGGIATKLADKYDLPVVLQIDDDWIEMEHRHSNYLKLPFLHSHSKRFCRELIDKTDRSFTVSETLKKIIAESWGGDPTRIDVVPNGVDPERFKPMDEDDLLKGKYDLQGKTMVFVGKLGPWHGVDTLLKATPVIKKEYPDFKAVIVGGDQKDVKRYRKKAGDEVVFTGKVPYKEVPKYINLADICVAPYPDVDYGFSPFKVFEYMACEKPVLTSDLPSLREILSEDTAILSKPGDPEILAENASEAFKRDLEDMGKKARQKILDEYTWKKSTEKLVDVYKKALESHS
ncbi:MAG: glycosyltransferase family 4 protein [Candidatus Thermoplasmatota archaeon]|nr:glycosyltransferase family 4 protein [Candidatus Thermoplasmatota archaeon]